MKLPQITGDNWFNSKPLKPADLAGRVVLVDFWTYSCVNCRRTLPFLKEWWQKYKDKGFVIVGIHAPEFEFEKNPENVARAIEDLGVDWPVVMDNDYVNWNNFDNHYWPAKYLADKNGDIVYTHFGEGAYAKTEKIIQDLLKSGGNDALPKINAEEAHGNVCFIATPEIYCGYSRGNLANKEGYKKGEVSDYKKPENMPDDSIALAGKFLAMPEYVESKEKGAELLLKFKATEVNLVLKPSEESARIKILFGNNTPEKSIRGRDADEEGKIQISKPTMYNLLKSEKQMKGTLSIQAESGGFQAFAFTFSGCEH